MSSRIFQNVIVQMKDATDRVIGVIDRDGIIVACNDISMVGSRDEDAPVRLKLTEEEVAAIGRKTYKKLVSFGSSYDFAVFAEGVDESARCLCMLAAVSLNLAKTYFDERYDKAAFIKSILFNNVLIGDIHVRARELYFEADAPRAAFLVRQIDGADMSAIDVVQSLFPDKQRDFVIGISETDIVVIKEVSAITGARELQKTAQVIQNRIRSELGIDTVIGIGAIANHLTELADAYKKANIAIEIGKVFEIGKSIITYDNLGIGRLIYQLPTTLCEIFLSEVFRKSPIESLDEETLFTINKFFENDLNVSETSRKLFVHRNTLVYRLEKIKKLTGLDLREFDNAIVFKVALMVKKYLVSQEKK